MWAHRSALARVCPTVGRVRLPCASQQPWWCMGARSHHPVAWSSSKADAKPITAVRGMHDALGEAAETRERAVDLFRELARASNFRPVETPVVEETRLFARSLGAASDVVMKEMYCVTGGSGALSTQKQQQADGGASGSQRATDAEELALRPEGTAGVMRALINGGHIRVAPAVTKAGAAAAAAPQPAQRLFYAGPMFRHERPQKGRFRQFSQLGVELVGGAGDVQADLEVLALADAFLRRLVTRQPRPPAFDIALQLNTLGDGDSMRAFTHILTEYFNAHRDALSATSVARLDRGAALRILDSKDAGDRVVVAGAPRIDACLTPAAAERFAAVQEGLSFLGIPFTREHSLVRGLDYYRHTIFEFVAVDHLTDAVAADSGAATQQSQAAAAPSAADSARGVSSRVDAGCGREVDGPLWSPAGNRCGTASRQSDGAARTQAGDNRESTPLTSPADGTGNTSAAPPAASKAEVGGSHLGTLLAGGRYDALAPLIGGSANKAGAEVPAIGWAAGLERLCMLLPLPAPRELKVAVLPMIPKSIHPSAHEHVAAQRAALGLVPGAVSVEAGSSAATPAPNSGSERTASVATDGHDPASSQHVASTILLSSLRVAAVLRSRGVPTELMDRTADVKKALSAASKSGCSLAVLMGESELVAGSSVVKNMASGEQHTVSSLSDLVALVEQQRQQSFLEPSASQDQSLAH